MAQYPIVQDGVAVGIETTSGYPASLTRELKTLVCAAPVVPKVTGTPFARGGYMRGTAGPLYPLVGRRGHTWSLSVEDRFVTATIDVGTDAQWDDRGIDALLRSCGFAAAKAAGTRTYTLAYPATESCTIEAEHGPKWVQGFGCRGAWSYEWAAGRPAMWTFEMQGGYFPPEEDAISGTTFTDDLPPPPMGDNSIAEIGTFTTPFLTSLKINSGNKVQSRDVNLDLQHPVRSAITYDLSSTTFLVDTTDINSATANDVLPIASLATADASGDYLAFVERHRFCGVKVNVGTVGVGTYTVTPQYYNGSTWTTLTGGTDQINNWKTSGVVYFTFTPPSDWARTTINSVEGYAIRFFVSAWTSTTTVPIITQAWTLYPPNGTHSAEVLDTDGITVDMTLELEAAATFDPFTAFEDYTSKSLAFYVGPGTSTG
jgi:hypothetical protein